MHPDHPPWDEGLQPERTAVAWSRTCVALAVVALLVLRSGHVAGMVLGFATLFAASAISLSASLRSRQVVAGLREGHMRPPLWPVAALAGFTLMVPIGALVLLLVLRT